MTSTLGVCGTCSGILIYLVRPAAGGLTYQTCCPADTCVRYLMAPVRAIGVRWVSIMITLPASGC